MLKFTVALLLFLISIIRLNGQAIDLDKSSQTPIQVSMRSVEAEGRKAIRVTKDTAVKLVDEATFVRISNIEFRDGIIELKVLSRLLPDAKPQDRGFIGLAFRISQSNDKFECIYIRPTNGRAEQQLRRNRSTQYFSYPDFKFDRLRKEAAGEYESYADMGLNEWIQLKHGADNKGAIGLFVDVGTEGFFTDLKITKQE